MKNSHIEWCHDTHNHWLNCRRKSPGCVNCYIERAAPLLVLGLKLGGERHLTSWANRRKPLAWDRAAKLAGVRRRVFCQSLGDWLDEEVKIEWLADLLKLIYDTPNLDWLLLTKRPENWRDRLMQVRELALESESWEVHSFVHGWLVRLDKCVPANIWIGTTVEDQARADERIPILLNIPAKVRFLSCEPLLEHVSLTNEGVLGPDEDMPRSVGYMVGRDDGKSTLYPTRREALIASGIDWVICGGESGPNAHPMHPDWARSLRYQCWGADVPFFFKQWGEWLPSDHLTDETPDHDPQEITKLALDGTRGNDVTMPCEKRYGMKTMCRVGKKVAGRLLDGHEWNEFPKA